MSEPRFTAEHDPFVAVPNWVWQHENLTHADVRVYVAIKHFWNRRTGQCNPSHETIGAIARVHRDQVRKASIPRLIKAGVLDVAPNMKGGQRSNDYIIKNAPQNAPESARVSDPTAQSARGLNPPRAGLTPYPGAGLTPYEQEEPEQEHARVREALLEGHHYWRPGGPNDECGACGEQPADHVAIEPNEQEKLAL